MAGLLSPPFKDEGCSGDNLKSWYIVGLLLISRYIIEVAELCRRCCLPFSGVVGAGAQVGFRPMLADQLHELYFCRR